MGGPRFEDTFQPRGHGPASFGEADDQFEEVQHVFSKLDIGEKKSKNGGPQSSKSTRRVSFNTPGSRGTPRQYEYHHFEKRGDWTVADRSKMPAPQEELEKIVARGKKTTSVLETLKKMSQPRRAQIDRLVDMKNLGEDGKDAAWHCVFIDSPNPKVKDVGGKKVMEHLAMNVIVAQHILPGRSKSTSRERSKSFVGERSDINEPLQINEIVKDKDKQSKGGKEGKGGHDHRDDPFDSKQMFNKNGAPLDNLGPMPGLSPQPQFFDQGMGQPFGPPQGQSFGPPQGQSFGPPQGQPFGPPQGQPFGPPQGQSFGPPQGQSFGPPQGQPPVPFEPMAPGPAANPVFGNPFSQMPHPGQDIPSGIEILHEPMLPHNGADEALHSGGPLPFADNNMPPHNPPPNFQHAHPDDFHGAGSRGRNNPKQPKRPIIVQKLPKGRRDSPKNWINDDSSRDSDEEAVLWDDGDERSSNTSYGDEHEKPVRRGSLAPHRRSSTKRREPVYREHSRGASYPVERPPPRPLLEPRRDSRRHQHAGHAEMVVERRRPRHSSRERREAIKYEQPPQLEYHSRSPPLTPISSSSYSPMRRNSGLPYPYEIEREREHERQVEEYMREKSIQHREEELHRRERELDDREFFDRSSEISHRNSRQGRYWPR